MVTLSCLSVSGVDRQLHYMSVFIHWIYLFRQCIRSKTQNLSSVSSTCQCPWIHWTPVPLININRETITLENCSWTSTPRTYITEYGRLAIEREKINMIPSVWNPTCWSLRAHCCHRYEELVCSSRALNKEYSTETLQSNLLKLAAQHMSYGVCIFIKVFFIMRRIKVSPFMWPLQTVVNCPALVEYKYTVHIFWPFFLVFIRYFQNVFFSM